MQNLANKEYYLNKFDLSGFGQPTTEGQPGTPREWYISVQRNFQGFSGEGAGRDARNGSGPAGGNTSRA